MMTKNKTLAQKYAPCSYQLTDTPYCGYEIHIAKTSCGWLPLFQGHQDGINSVREYKEAYETGEFEIFDIFNDLLKTSSYSVSTVVGNTAVEDVKIYDLVAKPGFEVAVGHGQLVEITEHGEVAGNILHGKVLLSHSFLRKR